MASLAQALRVWGTPDFEPALKAGIEGLDPAWLPLQQGLAQGSRVSDEPFRAMLIRVQALPEVLQVKAGIFYTGVIAGCSCADDPTPLDTCTEYCVVQLLIDRETGEASVELLPDP